MHFYYRVTFTGYIRCFCATTSQDLVTLTFDLLTLRVFRVQCFSCPTHIPIIIILRLSVTELRVLAPLGSFDILAPYKLAYYNYLITFPLSETVTAHALCHVTSNRGKIVHIFEYTYPNLSIHFVTFRALRRRLSHVTGKKIAFSHYEGYKVYCACAVSRELCIGGPP